MSKYLDTKAVILSIIASLVLILCSYFYNRYFTSEFTSYYIMLKPYAEESKFSDDMWTPAIIKLKIENTSNNNIRPERIVINGVDKNSKIFARYLEKDTDTVYKIPNLKYAINNDILTIDELPVLKQNSYLKIILNGNFYSNLAAKIISRSGTTTIEEAQYVIGTEKFVATTWKELLVVFSLLLILIVYSYERQR